jgi:S1-C subfamily serine protease
VNGIVVAGALLAALLLGACARAPAPDPDPPDRYTQLYDRLHPSVVLFTMQIPADDPKRKGQWDEAYGSGAIVASGAWGSRILTDAHVVADARDLRAKTGDRGKAVPARVAATSDDDDDLALVDIATPNLPPVTFGTMREVAAGRAIGVLGYPIPDAFEDEHLRAVVSLYTGRIASVRNGTLEIDVPVIPGESGGPVFDAASGDVIGLAESRFDDERAIGFATPVDVVYRFLSAHPRR